MDIQKFRTLVQDFAMNTEFVAPRDFTVAHLDLTLKSYSVPVFIGYTSDVINRQTWWHDVVLYDIVKVPGSEAIFQVMDPAIGYDTYLRKDFFPVNKTSQLLVGWKSLNRKGKQY